MIVVMKIDLICTRKQRNIHAGTKRGPVAIVIFSHCEHGLLISNVAHYFGISSRNWLTVAKWAPKYDFRGPVAPKAGPWCANVVLKTFNLYSTIKWIV